MADNSIRLFDPLPQNSLLVIRRETEKDSPLVDFENGASLVEEDLDLAILQLLHICQENYDALGGSVAEQYAEDARRTLEECIRQLEECRKEVAKAKAQADRAELEADRAEAAADRADGIADLACGATNLEAVWVTTSPMTRGTVFTLPNGITYFPGRRTLVLHAEGVRWYPGMQYEEVRQTGAADASPDATSNQVRILFDLPANIPMHVMVIASNIAKYVTETLERIEQILKEIEELVRRAETAADEAEKARDIAQNAAQEATEQADRAEEAADDAEHAAAAVDRMTRRRGIYTVRAFSDLVLVPNAFAIIWADLPFRILEQLPLIPLEAPVSPEDVPCCPDGFYLGGDPCEGGGGGTEQPPDPEDPDGGDDDGGLGSIALCGARKKIWQSHVVHTGDDRA